MPSNHKVFIGQPITKTMPAKSVTKPEAVIQPQPECDRICVLDQMRTIPETIMVKARSSVNVDAASRGLLNTIIPAAPYSNPPANQQKKLDQPFT